MSNVILGNKTFILVPLIFLIMFVPLSMKFFLYKVVINIERNMSFRNSPILIKQIGISASVKKIPIPILKQVCGGWNQA